MTDYLITVCREDGSEETHNLVGATYLPDPAEAMEDGGDWELEDGHTFDATPQIDSVDVEEV